MSTRLSRSRIVVAVIVGLLYRTFFRAALMVVFRALYLALRSNFLRRPLLPLLLSGTVPRLEGAGAVSESPSARRYCASRSFRLIRGLRAAAWRFLYSLLCFTSPCADSNRVSPPVRADQGVSARIIAIARYLSAALGPRDVRDRRTRL